MREIIKKYVGEIMIVIGSGLFSYNIFNFSYRTGGGLPVLGTTKFEGVAYYYDTTPLILISVGVMLIVCGFLIVKKKNN